MTKTTSKIGVQILLDCLLKQGIEHLVFSPGSRNAPLVIGLVGSEKFHSVCIHDERSAAFYALGMALITRKPVPVICTSGSALLNYAPAVAEAYYQRIPFLVVSADRPLEWIDQGDGQTIRQSGVFSNFIDYQVSFPAEANSQLLIQEYQSGILNALHHGFKGPAHINMPFEEPLYELVDYQSVNALGQAMVVELNAQQEIDYTDLVNTWCKFQKRLVLVGQLPPKHGINSALQHLVNDPNTIVLTENTSNSEIEGIVPCIDRVLAAIDLNEVSFKPECLLVFGGAVISKKVKTFLRKSELKLVWKVGEDFPEMKTYLRLDQSFVIRPDLFLENFVSKMPLKESNDIHLYGNQWQRLFQKTEQHHVEFLSNAPYSDLKVMDIVLKRVPSNSVVHLGNSSIARYAQLFDLKKQLDFHCNRGTSGIDGSVSTAAGSASVQLDKLHTLLVGDVSFFYDSNALWNNFLTENFRIILIHNGGGGIFEIIPGPDKSQFRDDYFVAKHNFSAKHLCQAFQIDFDEVNCELELFSALEWLYLPSSNGRPKLLEIHTQNAENSRILQDYFDFINK